jgi:hypothetical protein
LNNYYQTVTFPLHAGKNWQNLRKSSVNFLATMYKKLSEMSEKKKKKAWSENISTKLTVRKTGEFSVFLDQMRKLHLVKRGTQNLQKYPVHGLFVFTFIM